ncbi:MAG: cadherin repeat domain-containing protein, partial [Pannonibacter indicus]
TILYSLDPATNIGDDFAVNEAGVLQVSTTGGTQPRLDFETLNRYDLRVRVSDGLLHSWGTVVVNVRDVNEPPVLASSITLAMSDKAAVGSRVGTPITAHDPDIGQTLSYQLLPATSRFTITAATGQLFLADDTGLLTATSFSVRVRVTDNGTPPLWAEADVTVLVFNQNEPPVMQNHNFTVPENSPVNTPVGTSVE